MVEAHLSRRIVTPSGERDGAVLVEGERIVAVSDRAEIPLSSVRHDWGDQAILPGLVDTHVHINEPGRTEWEGFATATRAAAAGGYTTLVDMPLNCLPETTTVQALEAKRSAAHGKCAVDWMSWGGAVDGNQEHLQPLARAGVPGYKCFLVYPGCEGFTSIDVANLRSALPEIAATGLPLLVHAELQGLIDAAMATLPREEDVAWRRYATYLASRPDEAELTAIQTLIELCREFRFRLHIVHLSTALALPMLRAARAEGLPVTVETCPHYLHLCAEEIQDGATEFKCAPPVRSRANRELLWQALRDGDIDLIATDHSPCPPEMKRGENGRFSVAWGGIASLSTALRVVWTEASRRGFGLSDVARWMGRAPASLADVSHQVGSIESGYFANLVFFDPNAREILNKDQLHYRHPVSPYLGETLQGRVVATMLRGQFVYREGAFAVPLRGQELSRRDTMEQHRMSASETTLERWNRADAEEAAAMVLPCCGSRGWAAGLAARRPLGTLPELLTASDSAWWSLPEQDWMEAFATHPALGERHAQSASAQSLQWSSREQAALNDEEAALKTRIAENNLMYQQKFGRVFLLRAAGRSAAEVLAMQERRLRNTPETELQESAEQQREITHLRLQRWLAEDGI